MNSGRMRSGRSPGASRGVCCANMKSRTPISRNTVNWIRTMQALHDGLIGAMAGHGEKRTADQAGPECVLGREVPGKVEDLQFVASRSGRLRDFCPAARNAVQQHEEGDGASGQV